MKKILFVTNSNLFPNNNGAVIYSISLIKYLKELGNSISLVNFYTDIQNNKEEIKELKKYCNDIIQIKLTRPNYWQNISFKYPITIKKYYRKAMIVALQELTNKTAYDIAMYDHLHMGIYHKYVKAEKHIIVEHNIETDIWRSYMKYSKGLKKLLVYTQVKLFEKHEIKILNQIKNVSVISSEDANKLNKVAENLNICVYNPRVKCERVKQEKDVLQTKNSIVFVGSYSWFPNQEAARFLALELMPTLRKSKLDIKLFLVGNKPTQEMLEYNYKDIIVTGKVKSVDPYINDADIFINPIESGSGLNIKLVEAMGKGIPIISSEFGVRGFNITNNKELIVYKSLHDLVGQINNLVNDPLRRVKLSENAIEYYNKYINDNKEIETLLDNCI